MSNCTRICLFALQGKFVSSWSTKASVNDIYFCLFSPGNKKMYLIISKFCETWTNAPICHGVAFRSITI